jgi:hypothetical protein
MPDVFDPEAQPLTFPDEPASRRYMPPEPEPRRLAPTDPRAAAAPS